jgi:hypothetical protein
MEVCTLGLCIDASVRIMTKSLKMEPVLMYILHLSYFTVQPPPRPPPHPTPYIYTYFSYI